MYSLDDPIETQGQADEAAEMVLVMSKLAGCLAKAMRTTNALVELCGLNDDEIPAAMLGAYAANLELTSKISDIDDALSIWQDKIEGRRAPGVVN